MVNPSHVKQSLVARKDSGAGMREPGSCWAHSAHSGSQAGVVKVGQADTSCLLPLSPKAMNLRAMWLSGPSVAPS